MKNIKKALLLGIAFLGVGAITACDKNNNNGQQQVENDATKALDKILLNQDKGIVTANFEVVSTVKYNGTSYDISWKADKDVVSFVKKSCGFVKAYSPAPSQARAVAVAEAP